MAEPLDCTHVPAMGAHLDGRATMNFTRWIPGCCLAGLLHAPSASADDCGRVADAYAKGAREKRTALSDVDDPKRGATTPPLRIWTEKAEYVSDMRGGIKR